MIEEILKNLEYGLEIGGPSGNFYHTILLYKYVKKLDGFNIFENNNWQKNFSKKYKLPDKWDLPNKILGLQYNYDISQEIKHDRKYDFIVSSHVIEHFANPIKNILNMKKLLKNKSYIISVIPHYKYIFDSKRKLTEFEHIIDDYLNDVGEDDMTHVDDFISNYVSNKKDKNWVINFEKLKKDSHMNLEKRVIHHYTYDENNVNKLFEYCGFENLYTNVDKHGNILIISKKMSR